MRRALIKAYALTVNSCPPELGRTAAAQQAISAIHRHFSLKFRPHRALLHLSQQRPWQDPRLSAKPRDATRGASLRLTNGHLPTAEIEALKPSIRNGRAALKACVLYPWLLVDLDGDVHRVMYCRGATKPWSLLVTVGPPAVP